MAEPGLSAENLLASDTYLALVTFSSTRDYRRIVDELAEHEIRLEHTPFTDGRGEIAARALQTMDIVIRQTTQRWKLFKRLVGVHRYLLSIYLVILLMVSLFTVIAGHSGEVLSTKVVWWLILGNILGLISLGAIAQVDKNTLSESEKIEKLVQKRTEFINALKRVQSPEFEEQLATTRVPIRDEKGQMTLIRHHQAKSEHSLASA